MKKILALFLTLCMVLSTSACIASEIGDATLGETTDKIEETSESKTDSEGSNEPSEGTTGDVVDNETESETDDPSTETDSTDTNDKESEHDMKEFLNSALVIRAGNEHVFKDGARALTFNKNEVPFLSDGKVYVSNFYLMDVLGIYADDELVVSRNGVDYAPAILAEEFGYSVFTSAEHELVVISENTAELKSDAEKRSFGRTAANLLALGTGGISAKMKGNRPVLFTTDEMIATSKANALAYKTPWSTNMSVIKQLADQAIVNGVAPNTGTSATAFRLAACTDLINAHYIAVTYLYTEDSKYLNAAVSFLLAYAEPMLGTSQYLDYSAATTDGKADIGLNIAAPLTTACEVYSLLYPYIGEDDKATIEKWIRVEAELVIEGHEYWIANSYYDNQLGNNHLTSHLMGIVAAALVLEDDGLLDYALSPEKNPSCLSAMITLGILMEGDEVWYRDTDSKFRPGEIYDRYRVVSKPSNGFGYSMYHLKFMTHTALMLYNNGVDYFSYYGENGENMKLSFRVYADYLIQNDASLHGGHYTGNSLTKDNAYSTYLIANYIYDDETISSVINAFEAENLACFEKELFGKVTPFIFYVKRN